VTDDLKNLDQALQRAITHHREGRLAEAEALYRRILASAPDNPQVVYLLGMLANQCGRSAEAVSLLRRAVSKQPDQADYHRGLGLALVAVGQLREAVGAYQEALRLRPQWFAAYLNLGHAYRQSGRLEDAMQAYKEALRIDANTIEPYLGLAEAQRLLGDYQGAHETLQRALHAWPNNADVHLGFSILARDQGEYIEALRHYDRALAINPGNARTHYYRAIALQELGRVEEARSGFRDALACDPNYVDAYRGLVGNQRYTERSAEIEAMERLWERVDIAGAARIQLAFALGKVSEDLGQYDDAFRYFAAGNRLKRDTFQYDIAQHEDYVDRVIEVFNSEFFAARGDWGSPDATPIVICGMPRSGTTLVEQILASHPQVAGAGEVSDLQEAVWRTVPALTQTNFPEGASAIDRTDFAHIGEAYVARLRARHARGVRHVTDKLPSNIQFLGMLRVMLPRARVIHCRRNALDTCWSIYKTYFAGHQPFAYNLAELGRYYRSYERLMSHWAAVLPGDLLEFDYEAVVEDQEAATRRLLEYCGLPWDPQCLKFHKTDRTVTTASLSQVRRPLYAGSIGVGEKYADHLGPLMEALGVRR